MHEESENRSTTEKLKVNKDQFKCMVCGNNFQTGDDLSDHMTNYEN